MPEDRTQKRLSNSRLDFTAKEMRFLTSPELNPTITTRGKIFDAYHKHHWRRLPNSGKRCWRTAYVTARKK